jgi:hypothetical protein
VDDRFPFYLDENVSERLATGLNALGHDAVTTAELGRKGATDVSQLSFAARERRILITYDTDHFEMLHEAWRSWSHDWGVQDRIRHAGILRLPDPGILPVPDATRVVIDLLKRIEAVENRLFVWLTTSGWQEITVAP